MEKRVENGRFIYSFNTEETKQLLGQGLSNLVKTPNILNNLEQSKDCKDTNVETE